MIFFFIFYFLILFAIIIYFSVYIYSMLRARLVPYVISYKGVNEIIISRLKDNPRAIFIDLGCGDARLLSMVTEKFPTISARGYEIALYPLAKARQQQKKDCNRYKVIGEDFMKADLSDANVIFCYLLPHYMESIWKKIKNQCQAGTQLYSLAFPIFSIRPIDIIKIPDENLNNKVHNLYLYQV
jgi:hypothetical protein